MWALKSDLAWSFLTAGRKTPLITSDCVFPPTWLPSALLFAALTSQECLCVVRRVRRRVGVKFTTAASQVWTLNAAPAPGPARCSVSSPSGCRLDSRSLNQTNSTNMLQQRLKSELAVIRKRLVPEASAGGRGQRSDSAPAGWMVRLVRWRGRPEGPSHEEARWWQETRRDAQHAGRTERVVLDRLSAAHEERLRAISVSRRNICSICLCRPLTSDLWPDLSAGAGSTFWHHLQQIRMSC